ncbi:MAG: beta-galactosidase [Oscillospiraceae bacterium]
MTELSFNSTHMIKDGKPWFPTMGELHYSRYPKEYWKEALFKMKAGGIQIVSSYVIWIHHEEIKGEYDFSGNRDLRYFLECCKECGIYMFLRIGPWCHAEVRNGGFPDWLKNSGINIRTNDKRYLDEVRKYYAEIYKHAKGHFLKDGGAVIGVQIENEFGHCGGLSGVEGEFHIKKLYEAAREIGFDVPIYTATGWGGAVTGGLLPVMGGYCEAPWDQRTTEIEPSGNYIFTYERNDHNIGSDYGIGEGITFDPTKFPYFTAELGGGLQITHHRRPVAYAEDIGAMSLAKMGSGCNLLGYYMYHGGTNPKGRLTTLQESRESDYLNDLPEMSYDFRAPIREYGQISDIFKELKLLTMFLDDFGSGLCEMPAYIPKSNPIQPTNLSDLRTSVRHNGESGYLFVNNYQRRYKMAEHLSAMLSAKINGKTISFPKTDIKNRDYCFFPLNMKIKNAVLKSALATPLCKINEDAFVFYTDREPQYCFESECDAKIITLSKAEAKNAYRITLDKQYLIISEDAVVTENDGVYIYLQSNSEIKIYPEPAKAPKGHNKTATVGDFTVWAPEKQLPTVFCSFGMLEKSDGYTSFEINIAYKGEADDCFLNVDYDGDMAKLYLNDEQIGDSFYTGAGWEIGLKQFEFPEKLRADIYPLDEEADVFLEKRPEFIDGRACRINSIIVYSEKKIRIF